MANVVEGIIAVLSSGSPEEREEALLQAGFFFEKARGWPDCGWSADVQTGVASEDKVARLKMALIEFVTKHVPPPPLESAIYALSALEDPSLKILFQRCMEIHRQRDMAILFAAMLALDRMGEEVFPRDDAGRSHASFLELERNRDLAFRYLHREDG
jgi:hypothetical protein